MQSTLEDLERQWSAAIEAAARKDADPVSKRQALSTLSPILAADYTNTGAAGDIFTKEQEIENFSSGAYEVTSVSAPSEMEVRVFGDSKDFAVVTGRDEVDASFRSRVASGAYRWTDTWVKTNGRWQCVASHSSKIEDTVAAKVDSPSRGRER